MRHCWTAELVLQDFGLSAGLRQYRVRIRQLRRAVVVAGPSRAVGAVERDRTGVLRVEGDAAAALLARPHRPHPERSGIGHPRHHLPRLQQRDLQAVGSGLRGVVLEAGHTVAGRKPENPDHESNPNAYTERKSPLVPKLPSRKRMIAKRTAVCAGHAVGRESAQVEMKLNGRFILGEWEGQFKALYST